MTKDRLAELKQRKRKRTTSTQQSLTIVNRDDVKYSAIPEEPENIAEHKEEEVALNVEPDDNNIDQDEVEEEEEEHIEVPHNPVIEALLNMYSEILEDFDVMKTNLDLMKEMILAKNARNFSEKEFYKLRQRTIQIANNVMSKFQTIEMNLPKGNDYTTIARMKRILYYGIFQQYVDIWTVIEQFLQDYETKMKQNLRAQSRILEIDLTEEEIDTLVSNKHTNLYACNILEDTENARKTLDALMQRLGELQKLEKSIEHVHTLFIRLQHLVSEQGAVIQSIERHYNDAQNYVEQAAGDINSIQEAVRSSLKKRIIFVIITIIILLVIILIIISV